MMSYPSSAEMHFGISRPMPPHIPGGATELKGLKDLEGTSIPQAKCLGRCAKAGAAFQLPWLIGTAKRQCVVFVWPMHTIGIDWLSGGGMFFLHPPPQMICHHYSRWH